MKPYAHYLFFLLLTLTATACSPDDEESSPTIPHGAQPMQIEVTTQPFAPGDEEARTRGYSGDNFKFEKDDQIGIIGIKNGTIINNNYAYKYDGSSWSPVNDTKFCHFEQGMKYIAYYPYSSKMDDKKSKEEILAAFKVPTTQNFSPQADLMYSEISPTTATLSFNMEHALALLSFPFPQAKLEWEGQTLYSTFGKDQISDPEFIVGDVKYTINMDNNAGDIKLLVKPGNNIKITCKLQFKLKWVSSLSCEAQVTLKANTSYTVIRKFKISASNMKEEGIKFCMRQNDKFGFPCPTTNMPEGCIEIGTIARQGNMGGHLMVSGNPVTIMNYNNGYSETTVYGANPNYYTPNNNETYYRSDGTGKAAKDWNGYVISNLPFNDYFYTYDGTAISNNDVMNLLGGTKNQDLSQLSYQAFTRSYNAVNNSNATLKARFPVFKPLYDPNSELLKRTPKNTSKWFLPGILEFHMLSSASKNEKKQWLTDYPKDNARYPYFYFGRFTDMHSIYVPEWKFDTSRYILAF